jgi:hypothetical protein
VVAVVAIHVTNVVRRDIFLATVRAGAVVAVVGIVVINISSGRILARRETPG